MGATTTLPFRYRRFGAAGRRAQSGSTSPGRSTTTTFAAVREAFLDSEGVLILRDQRITPEQHIDFSRRFGPLAIHVLRQFLLQGHPEILLVSNVVENGKPIGLGDAGRYWHSDLSYVAEPSLGSLLHASEIPSEGGDTSFANLSAAYDALPADMKRRIDGKRAVHSYRKSYDILERTSSWRPPAHRRAAAGGAGGRPSGRAHPSRTRAASHFSSTRVSPRASSTCRRRKAARS